MTLVSAIHIIGNVLLIFREFSIQLNFHYNSGENLLFYDKVVLGSTMNIIENYVNNYNSASADGGPRSRVRARGTLRSAPHQR